MDLADYINTEQGPGHHLGYPAVRGHRLCVRCRGPVCHPPAVHLRLSKSGCGATAALWGGLALSMITYFILIKGAKGASFITPAMLDWINTHTWTIIGGGFGVFTVLFQLLMLLTRINIFKPIVLAGTFALAMAFAANDLVNFIGVPLASFHAYPGAKASANPPDHVHGGASEAVHTNTLLLLAGRGGHGGHIVAVPQGPHRDQDRGQSGPPGRGAGALRFFPALPRHRADGDGPIRDRCNLFPPAHAALPSVAAWIPATTSRRRDTTAPSRSSTCCGPA